MYKLIDKKLDRNYRMTKKRIIYQLAKIANKITIKINTNAKKSDDGRKKILFIIDD